LHGVKITCLRAVTHKQAQITRINGRKKAQKAQKKKKIVSRKDAKPQRKKD